jgi:Putative auto-transporter adhesin, head GIN domain
MQKIILILMLILTSLISSAQLRGSGKTVTKTYGFKDFDKIYFEDLDGKIEVEIGKTWSISVTIDDNLLPLLSFKSNQSDKELTIYFKGNSNNNLYIEDTNVKIKVTMPEVAAIVHDGNSKLTVLNVKGSYFKIENSSNATSTISGIVANLEVKNTGNGNVFAENLIAKTAKVKSTGNGNAKVNVADSIEAVAKGNGSVFNKGKAKFDTNSTQSGNGRLISI